VAEPWRNRIVGTGEEAPDQLVANPSNWRTHPGAQRDALRGSLSEVGWVQQVMVNRRTGFVVDGHARVEEALSRGEPTVPVLYVDLSPEEEALVLATLDPIGAMATRDDAKLAELLAGIAVDNAGLLALLADLAPLKPMVGLTDPDDVPDVEETTIKAGDLFALGDHRLLCGDAVNPEHVARLLDGAKPRLLNTDPPYGVQYDATWRDGIYNGTNKRVGGWPVKQGGERPYMMQAGAGGQPEKEDAPVAAVSRRGRTVGHRNTAISGDTRADWSEAFALVPSLEIGYVWYASAHTLEVLTGLLGIGFELAQQIIWDKVMFSIGRNWYHWSHEPCFVVRKPGVPNLFIGTDHTQSTMWRAASPKRLGAGSTEEKTDHPTQKPVVLFEIPISNHLHRGEAVYEPFSGSGTCLVAAERLGRRCYAMEIDPKYVAVAIKRWEQFTGQQAEQI
jgi:DNA modification methylase